MGNRPKYTNADDMQAIIYQYFEDCKKNTEAKKNGWGEPKDIITYDIHPTISGLAVALGLTRQSIYNYEAKDEFFDTVCQAKAIIEAYNEQGLQQNVSGIIFNLKNNFNWKDKQELEHSGDIEHNGGVCRMSEILQGFIESRQKDIDEGTVQE